MVAIVAIGTASCGFPDPPHHNVLLISIDTLRADHLGAYGYEKGTSPAIDALAEDSILFRKAIAAAPSTLPSHASIFTSVLPHQHGAQSLRSRGGRSLSVALSEEFVTLTEVLRDAGYRTGVVQRRSADRFDIRIESEIRPLYADAQLFFLSSRGTRHGMVGRERPGKILHVFALLRSASSLYA